MPVYDSPACLLTLSAYDLLLRFHNRILRASTAKNACGLVKITLTNKSFTNVDPLRSREILILATEQALAAQLEQDPTKKGENEDYLADLGHAIQDWLCRLFNDDDQRGKVFVTMLDTFNELAAEQRLELHHEFLRKALRSLLQMHSDQKILIKNLERLNLDRFHPLVLDVFQERGISLSLSLSLSSH